MAKRIAPDELHQLARMGAMVRLRQLEEEAAAIRRMFPGLTPDGAAAAPEAGAKPRAAKKRGMSPAAREAARERMKAYWAKKKGEQAAPEGGQTQAADRPPKKRRARRTTRGKRARKTA